MKLFFIILLSVFIFRFGSNKNDNSIKKTPMGDTTNDTVVKIRNVSDYTSDPNYIKKEYYVLNNQDTSSFYCRIILDKLDKNIAIKCEYSFNEERTEPTSIYDSAKVVEVPEDNRDVKLITYSNFIKELHLILDTASKQFNFSRLKSFSIRMVCASGLTNYLNSQSILKYNRSIKNISISKFASLLQESPLTADLNRILKPYSVCLNKLYIEEYLFFPLKSKDMNFKYQVQFPNDIEVQGTMGMDGSAVFTLTPLLTDRSPLNSVPGYHNPSHTLPQIYWVW